MRTLTRIAMIGLCLSFSATAPAETVTEDFSTAIRWDADSSTAVWNFQTGTVHPPLVIKDIEPFPGGTVRDEDIEVGDGSDGDFVESNYSQFSENGDISGNIIRLNTETFAELNVTEFVLETGWTLRPTGDNPLIIRSLGDVTISGTIDCSGEDGEDFQSKAVAATGGVAHCGGGDGGNGGTTSSRTGDPGGDGGDNVDGGAGGSGTIGASGGNSGAGGGTYGGPFVTAPVDGDNNNGTTAASAGAVEHDITFETVGGGGGGGGGGVYDNGDNSESFDSSGGGGGAGGGVIMIFSAGDFHLEATGSITANGGNGGGGVSGKAGAGGGGSGGSVLIAVQGSAVLDATIEVEGGLGGTSNLGASSADGGQGRVWIPVGDLTFNAAAGVANISTVQDGNTEFSTDTSQVTSQSFDSFDFLTSRLSLSSFTADTTLPAGSSASFEVAVSSDDFVNDDSGFVSVSNISSLTAKRYFKFRATLINTDAANPANIDSVTIEYEPFLQTQFDFEPAASCGRVGTHPDHSVLFLLFMALFYCGLRLQLFTRRI